MAPRPIFRFFLKIIPFMSDLLPPIPFFRTLTTLMRVTMNNLYKLYMIEFLNQSIIHILQGSEEA